MSNGSELPNEDWEWPTESESAADSSTGQDKDLDWSFDNPSTTPPVTDERIITEEHQVDEDSESVVIEPVVQRLLDGARSAFGAVLAGGGALVQFGKNMVDHWSDMSPRARAQQEESNEPENREPVEEPYSDSVGHRRYDVLQEPPPIDKGLLARDIAVAVGTTAGRVVGVAVSAGAAATSTAGKYLFARDKSVIEGKVVKEPFGKWMKRAARNLAFSVGIGTGIVGGCDYAYDNYMNSGKPDAQPKSGSDVRGGSTIKKWMDSAGEEAGKLGDDAKNWAEKQMK